MTLKTLGKLELVDSEFTRPTPLLLLVYLSLQGPQERRHLAELFWPRKADPLNSLSSNLSRIRKGIEGAVESDEVRVWTPFKTDIRELSKALETHQLGVALELYKGPFLEGVYLEDWGTELEEWIYQKREALSTQMRGVYLSLAEQAANKGWFEQATAHAETAYLLKAAPDPEPEDLRRLYPLLLVSRSPQAGEVAREAKAQNVVLHQTPEEARALFQKKQLVLGRERELERLRNLPEGAWVWMRGSAGMGKTTLLKQTEGQYIPGRSGLPYATLEPLLGDLSEGEEILLRKLAKLSGALLLDGWEQTDPESQKLLTRLHSLKPNLRAVIASRTDPPFEVDQLMDLDPIGIQDLQAYPGTFEATGGLPALVGAYLRGEPLEAAFETRLTGLDTHARDVVLSLGLLEQPDLTLVRKALGLGAAQMAQALDSLEQSGLVDATGKLQAQQRVRDWLEGRQTLGAGLAIKLARLLEGIEAFPLWQRAQLLWEERDTTTVQESYIAWAKELLRRGFPAKAVEVLEGAPDGDEIYFWRGWCFERAGRFLDAVRELNKATITPEICAVRSSIYLRLGRKEEAKELAKQSLKKSTWARAEALSTLANISLAEGDYSLAEKLFARAAILWKSVNEDLRWGDSLNGRALSLAERGGSTEKIFGEILDKLGQKPYLKAKLLTNIGISMEKAKNYIDAEKMLREAIGLAENLGIIEVSSRAWNSLGVLYHNTGNTDGAFTAYEKALILAKQSGEAVLAATVLGNIAELSNDVESLEEAVFLLDQSGYTDIANNTRRILERMQKSN